MKRNRVRGIILIVVLLVVFCLIAFLPPFTKTSVFWAAFIFGLFATVIQVYFFHYSFAQGSDAKSRFYGIPIARIGLIYCIVQWIVSILEMVFAARMPAWVAILIDIVILAVAMVGGVVADTVREEIKRQDTKLKMDVSNMREMQSLANAVVGQCDDESLKKDLKKLSEEIRYSDPVGSEATDVLEEEMLNQLKEIQKAVVDGDSEAVKTMTEKVLTNLTERNRICKLNK